MASLTLSVDEPCPCGSGKIIKLCKCYRNGRLIPKACKARPAGSKSGKQHSRCYAKSTFNCSMAISKEHYISEAVLKLITNADPNNRRSTISGFHWLKGESLSANTNMLTSKVLCERHNNSYSNLDEIAFKFFGAIEKIRKAHTSNSSSQIVHAVNGRDLERWLVKTLCGTCTSGNASIGQQPIKEWLPSSQLIGVIEGREIIPDRAGLFFRRNHQSHGKISVGFAPMSDDKNNIGGAVVEFHGFGFQLLLNEIPVTRWPPDGEFDDVVYRPSELIFSNTKRPWLTHHLFLGWTDPAPDQKALQLIRTDD